MQQNNSQKPYSIFSKGFKEKIEELTLEIQSLYLEDEVPWVIGYSGGKDSSAIAQLVWYSIQNLAAEKRKKVIHIISTDTLVENPVVAQWVSASLEKMRSCAETSGLPIIAHRLTPKIENSFWVNLIGKGYPAPRNKFRWCTERLKIRPSNDFIREVVSNSGEALLVLGTRKLESAKRAQTMARHEQNAVRAKITANGSLPNSWVYTPIEDWSNDDVWFYLMQLPNPWGHSNKELLGLYSGASDGGECPLVVDSNTPSCGSSRFGCWVCTLVDKDKSMSAMIRNDYEKEWLLPMLDFRNEMDFRDDAAREKEKNRRDYRRMSGKITYFEGRDGQAKLVPGPYTQEARKFWLEQLLETQMRVREQAPQELKNIELITLEELREIRKIWVLEKHETEDFLPEIYRKIMGNEFPDGPLNDSYSFDDNTMAILRKQCGENKILFELCRNLIDIEKKYRLSGKRRGLYDALAKAIERCFYDSEEDAFKSAEAHNRIRTMDILEELLQDSYIQSNSEQEDVPSNLNTESKLETTL